jgi:hypothetical protein
VAIINDTLAYAVGEIYKRDSVGNWDPLPYNLVKWNGQRWQLLRIQFYTFCGQAGTGSYPAKSIFAFGPDDIWIGMNGSQVVRWNGQTQSSPECTPVSINKLWGENPSSIWAVGNNGQIAHYDGVRWRRIESGTGVDLLDVHGSPDGYVVWACGHYSSNVQTVLLLQRSGRWGVIYDGPMRDRTDSLSGAYESIYAPNARLVYVATGSRSIIYRALTNTRGEAKGVIMPPTFASVPKSIRGNGVNDWVVAGVFNVLGHFNGYAVKHFQELYDIDGRLLSVAQRQNVVMAVGYSYHPVHSKGVVIRGTR